MMLSFSIVPRPSLPVQLGSSFSPSRGLVAGGRRLCGHRTRRTTLAIHETWPPTRARLSAGAARDLKRRAVGQRPQGTISISGYSVWLLSSEAGAPFR